jgi:hypothetical protein
MADISQIAKQCVACCSGQDQLLTRSAACRFCDYYYQVRFVDARGISSRPRADL